MPGLLLVQSLRLISVVACCQNFLFQTTVYIPRFVYPLGRLSCLSDGLLFVVYPFVHCECSAMNMGVQYLFESLLSLLWGTDPGMELMGHT